MNIRKKSTVIFTVNKNIFDVAHFIGESICKKFGGATLTLGSEKMNQIGFWAQDGHLYKECYIGEILKEDIIRVEVIYMPTQQSIFLELIKSTLIDCKGKFDLDYQNIHIETIDIEAEHLNLP